MIPETHGRSGLALLFILSYGDGDYAISAYIVDEVKPRKQQNEGRSSGLAALFLFGLFKFLLLKFE